MSEAVKLSVAMTGPQAEMIRDAIASGAYADGNDVLQEALYDWSLKWSLKKRDIQHLRQLWDEGKASGEPVEVDLDDLLAEARAELKASRVICGLGSLFSPARRRWRDSAG